MSEGAGASGIDDDRCRVILGTPVEVDLEGFVPLLDEVLGILPVAALLLERQTVCPTDLARHLRRLCHGREAALLVQGTAETARHLGADGLLVEPGGIEAARGVLGDDAILIGLAGESRDEAMRAGEAGADAVLFGSGLDRGRMEAVLLDDCLRWWHGLFVLPSVVAGARTTPLEDWVEAGADFLLIDDELWRSPAGPVAAAERLARRLEAAQRTRPERQTSSDR